MIDQAQFLRPYQCPISEDITVILPQIFQISPRYEAQNQGGMTDIRLPQTWLSQRSPNSTPVKTDAGIFKLTANLPYNFKTRKICIFSYGNQRGIKINALSRHFDLINICTLFEGYIFCTTMKYFPYLQEIFSTFVSFTDPRFLCN